MFFTSGDFFVFSPFLSLGNVHFFHDAVGQEGKQSAEDHGHQHIGGIVDIEVKSGESDEERQDEGGNAQLPGVEQEHHSCLKGGNGVA